MKTRLEQILDCCLNGREIAVWGSPTRAMLRELKNYKYHIAENVDPKRHYVVAVTEDDFEDFENDSQYEFFEDIKDCIVYCDPGGELPFEWECYGVKVGRQTYFGEDIATACQYGYVESIGHFSSINGSATIQVNHHMNMIFTSDEVADLLTEENKAKYYAALNADPAHPYAKNKPKITIGSDVYIGANVFINASKVTGIGHGAIVGSGAVVLENVPPYAVVVGIPAKIKRYRYSPEMIETLLRVQWWNWSKEEINANFDALMSPDEFMKRFG